MIWFTIIGQRAAMASWTMAPPGLSNACCWRGAVAGHPGPLILGQMRARSPYSARRSVSLALSDALRPTVMVKSRLGILSSRSMDLPALALPLLIT